MSAVVFFGALAICVAAVLALGLWGVPVAVFLALLAGFLIALRETP